MLILVVPNVATTFESKRWLPQSMKFTSSHSLWCSHGISSAELIRLLRLSVPFGPVKSASERPPCGPRLWRPWGVSIKLECVSALVVVLCRLQEVSDVAMMQASALQARQQSNEKEVDALRRQILDYQVLGCCFFDFLKLFNRMSQCLTFINHS